MSSVPMKLITRIEQWPIAGSFSISRGSKTEAVVVMVELSRDGMTGRGECVPYARYGETPEDTLKAIGQWTSEPLSRELLNARMAPGAARNALDCALWDLEAKTAGRRVWDFTGDYAPQPLTTAYTISLGTPQGMAKATAAAAHRPLLKVKLGGEGDAERIAAVRHVAPHARLIVDANEAWTETDLERNLEACADAGVTLVEQPLPAGRDEALGKIRRAIPVCADESVHATASLERLQGRYDAINIKLDKTGGLTEALAMRAEAKRLGFEIMVGCMVATSLSMAPATLVAQGAAVVDLDGPLLLAKDREHGLRYEESVVYPPDPMLWG
ncbi:MAG: dipeptide epimerase [Xanthobacteraceae bacterium]|nr:dipeptide epimerase [Xanthobacteraceae bacterium]